MKLFKAIEKNLKILFRKKSSLLTIVLGPLLVILVLGLAFSSASNIKISLGYVAPDDSPLTLEFIDSLSQSYLAKEFIYKENCVQELEQGILHACIIFPPDLAIENNKTNNILFIVDKSRISMVYSVIDSITADIDIKTNELSRDLTDVILNTLISTDEGIDSTLSLVVATKSITSEGVENSDDIIGKFDSISDDIASSGISDLIEDIELLHEYTSNIKDKVSSKTENSEGIVSPLVVTNPSLQEVLEDLEDMDDVADSNEGNSSEKLDEIIEIIEDIDNNLDEIESNLKDSKSLTTDQKESLVTLKSNIDDIKNQLVTMQNNIRNIEITSSSNIVNPINTQIETISTEENRLALILPYAIMLVIMFTALLLASTLVVLEKRSNASFRTFTTPTKDEFFILANYLTAFFIVAAQIAIIITAVDYFAVNIILSNIWVNLVLLLLSISLFIMIGMMIGYLLKTQQATNMATISIGAIFLFVSNIIFPLESIAPGIQRIADFNPFVITSEVMRKSILFNISFDKIIVELSLLLAYSIVFLILIIIFQKLSKTKYFNNLSFLRSKVNRFTKEFIELNDERIINKEELIDELKKMDDDTYKMYITKNYKEFKTFLNDVLDQKKLGNLKKISKDKLIQTLEKRIEASKKRLDKSKDQGKLIRDLMKKKPDKKEEKSEDSENEEESEEENLDDKSNN